MPRIRSVHPRLWTDEAFVSLSPLARLLAIGLWNECDDGGGFEWRPVQLKMRLLPADHVDIAPLLSELEANKQVARYSIDGRSYGAVRNFGRFQRPKKANRIHPMPDEFRTFAATEHIGSEPVPHPDGTGGEKSPQREEVIEGGNRRKGGGTPLNPPVAGGTFPSEAQVFNLLENQPNRFLQVKKSG
jgi:hypothetical protein